MNDAFGRLRQRLAVLPGPRPDRWTTVFFWGCLALAALSALPVFLITQFVTEGAERSRFVAAAEQAAYRLAHEVDLTLAHLRALKGLYEGSVHVSRDEFSAFVRALRPSAAVKSLEWIPRVPASERAAFEAAAREDGLVGFTFRQHDAAGRIVPADGRPDYFPVYYMEPRAGNEVAAGLDLGANPARLGALRRARDSGDQTASDRIRLAQDHQDQYGFSVFEPIYAETALTLDARIDRLEGFAHGVFRIADLIRLAIPEDQFQVAVLDLSAPAGAQRLYPVTDIGDDPRFMHAVTLSIADRAWSVRLAPVGASALSTLPWIAALTWLGVLWALWTLRELVVSRRHSEQLAAVNHRLEALSDQRQRAIRELERSNRELDDFAYIVSHDLKEPLRAVCNHATFLLDDYQDRLEEDGRMRLNRLITLGQRMQKLIGDLLFFSRLGRGEQAMEAVDLHAVIADVEASLAEGLQRRNAKVVIATPLPEVHGHRPHMTALFQNLISNAMKYNDSDEKIIEIGYIAGESEGPGAASGQFYVRDNGIGIEEAFKEEVFRIFKRLNGEQAYGEGTGAGLSFVKKIVESHGGTIWLTSAPGEGTTFFFTLEPSGQAIADPPLLEAA